jgi:hypothetical protein
MDVYTLIVRSIDQIKGIYNNLYKIINYKKIMDNKIMKYKKIMKNVKKKFNQKLVEPTKRDKKTKTN